MNGMWIPLDRLMGFELDHEGVAATHWGPTAAPWTRVRWAMWGVFPTFQHISHHFTSCWSEKDVRLGWAILSLNIFHFNKNKDKSWQFQRHLKTKTDMSNRTRRHQASSRPHRIELFAASLFNTRTRRKYPAPGGAGAELGTGNCATKEIHGLQIVWYIMSYDMLWQLYF